jgi:hypothetical protein
VRLPTTLPQPTALSCASRNSAHTHWHIHHGVQLTRKPGLADRAFRPAPPPRLGRLPPTAPQRGGAYTSGKFGKVKREGPTSYVQRALAVLGFLLALSVRGDRQPSTPRHSIQRLMREVQLHDGPCARLTPCFVVIGRSLALSDHSRLLPPRWCGLRRGVARRRCARQWVRRRTGTTTRSRPSLRSTLPHTPTTARSEPLAARSTKASGAKQRVASPCTGTPHH